MSLDLESRIAAANPIVGNDALVGLFGGDADIRLLHDVRAKQEGRMSDVTKLPPPAGGDDSEMSYELQPDTTESGPSRRAWMGAAAALAIVAGAALVVWLITSPGNDVATPETPLEVAEAFVNARDARDIETTLALLAPDVEIVNDLANEPEGYRTTFRRFEIMEWRTHLEECSVEQEGPPALVTCTYTHEGAWSQALGVGPYGGSRFIFRIEDGLITRVNNLFDTSEFSSQVWEVFAAWVSENHPDDVLRLYQDASQSGMLTTPEALDLLQQFTNEFVAEQGR